MRILSQQQDEAAVRRVRAGHSADYEILVHKHLPLVHAIVRGQLGFSCDVDDLAQEAFFTAYRSLHQLREPGRFAFWLGSIARNLCHQHRAAAARNHQVQEHFLATAEQVFQPKQERQELHEMLNRGLADLDPEHREILLLFYYSGQSLREIESSLGITREAAKKRLQRARAALGRQVEAQLGQVVEADRPTRAQSKRIASAAVVLSPEWAPIPSSAGVLDYLVSHITGGQAMLLSASIAASVVLAGAVTAQGLNEKKLPPEKSVVFAQAETSPVPVAPPPPVELQLPPAPAPGVTPQIVEENTQSEATGGVATSSKRTATMGGNAQRTGYYAVPAPMRQPQIVWEAPLGEGEGFPGSSVVVDAEGRIFSAYSLQGRQTYFAAYSPTGEKLWTHGSEKGGRLSAPQVSTATSVVKSLDKGLVAFDINSGAVLWRHQGTASNGSPVADGQGHLYMDGFESLFKFNGSTGSVVWTIPGSGSTAPSVTLSRDEKTLYLGKSFPGGDEHPAGLLAINTADGAIRWSFLPEDNAEFQLNHEFISNWASPVVGGPNLVYLQDAATGSLYAVADRGERAEMVWNYNPLWTGNEVREEHREDSVRFNEFPLRAKDSPRTVATDGEAVYMGIFGYPASVHAINADGSLRWKQPLEGDVTTGSPAVTGGAVYILGGGDDEVPGKNALYCLNKRTGEIVWQLQVAKPHGDVGESVAFGEDGTLYLATGGLDGHAVLMAVR